MQTPKLLEIFALASNIIEKQNDVVPSTNRRPQTLPEVEALANMEYDLESYARSMGY